MHGELVLNSVTFLTFSMPGQELSPSSPPHINLLFAIQQSNIRHTAGTPSFDQLQAPDT